MGNRLSDTWLDELRSRLNIVDVVSEYVPLKQKGANFWGLCPFHNEKTASFSVDPAEQFYYCFGCHKGGNVIHFVMDIERMEFMEAVEMLSQKAGFPMPSGFESGSAPSVNPERKERIYEANKCAAHWFHSLIWQPEGAGALAYLHKRALNDSDIRHFGLGASPSGWTDLRDYMITQGYDEDLLAEAGLVVRKDGRVYDQFRDRVMFPIINASGRVLGFGGRTLGDGKPKYLNTGDTIVFNKRRNLYASNFLRKEHGLRRLILVEGYMDVISLRKEGIPGVVATLGTALTEEQARMMKRIAPEVWVSYDGDEAGQKAIDRALDIFEQNGVTARVLVFPEGMDPDDFIRANGREGFERLAPLHQVDYRIRRAAAKRDMSREDEREQYVIECCGYLQKLKNPVELEKRVRRLSDETGYAVQTLMQQIGTVPAQSLAQERSGSRRMRRSEPQESEAEKSQRTLVALAAARRIPTDAVQAADFDKPLYRGLIEMLKDGLLPAQILGRVPEEQREETVRAFNGFALPEDPQKALECAQDCLLTIRRCRIEQSLTALKEEAKATADPERKSELLKSIMQLTIEQKRLAIDG